MKITQLAIQDPVLIILLVHILVNSLDSSNIQAMLFSGL